MIGETLTNQLVNIFLTLCFVSLTARNMKHCDYAQSELRLWVFTSFRVHWVYMYTHIYINITNVYVRHEDHVFAKLIHIIVRILEDFTYTSFQLDSFSFCVCKFYVLNLNNMIKNWIYYLNLEFEGIVLAGCVNFLKR